MLFAYFGSDTVEVRRKAHERIREAEGNGAVLVRIGPENFSSGAIEDAAGSASLFGGEHIYLIDTPSEDTTMFEFIFENLDTLAESANTFVLIEGKVLAADKKKLQKYAHECVEIVAAAAKAFNPFALSDALLARDKRSLWLLFHESKHKGMPAEQIAGLLFAALRSLCLTARSSSATEAGQKPFVFGKNKRALVKFKDEEVKALSEELISIYHEGHLGTDMDLALERWVLRL